MPALQWDRPDEKIDEVHVYIVWDYCNWKNRSSDKQGTEDFLMSAAQLGALVDKLSN